MVAVLERVGHVALLLSFVGSHINAFELPRNKNNDLGLSYSCTAVMNKNAAHGKLSSSHGWPTTTTAKECAKIAGTLYRNRLPRVLCKK